jgi:microcystin-dependent protein
MTEFFGQEVQVVTQGLPVGVMMDYGGTTAPTDWHLCDGAALSRSAFAALFAVIGVKFGSGDGSGTQFNLPDFRSRVAVGAGAGAGLTVRAAGDKGGAEVVQISQAQMPNHNHAATVAINDPGHQHNIAVGADSPDHVHGSTNAQYLLTANPGAQDNYFNNNDLLRPTIQAAIPNTGGANTRHNHPATADVQPTGVSASSSISGAGGDQTHENMTPFLACAKIIKVQ